MSSSLSCNILVQSNWPECLARNGGEFRVTFKEVEKQGDHDKVEKEGTEFVAKDEKFSVDMVSKAELSDPERDRYFLFYFGLSAIGSQIVNKRKKIN